MMRLRAWPTSLFTLHLLLVCNIFASVSQQTTSSNHGPDTPNQQANNATSTLFPMPLCNGVRLEEASVDQLQDYMKKRRLTSVQIVECYLQRLFQVAESIKYLILILIFPRSPN